MSNHFGLILSMIFLGFFLVLSGEVLAYQKLSAKAMNITNDIAIYIQENGYDYSQLQNEENVKFFDKFNVSSVIDEANSLIKYTITTTKKYTAFSELYSFMTQDIVCSLCVYRKE